MLSLLSERLQRSSPSQLQVRNEAHLVTNHRLGMFPLLGVVGHLHPLCNLSSTTYRARADSALWMKKIVLQELTTSLIALVYFKP